MISEVWTIHIHHGAQLEVETFREHPRHSELQRYGVELRGIVGKDVVKHQRRPTSHYEERCCEPLLDVDRPTAEILAKEVSSKVPCEKGKPNVKVPWSHQ